MIELFKSQYLLPTKEFRCLSMLLAIHHFPRSSQNTLGKMTHLSSSMVNNYIKTLKKDRLLEVRGTTNRSHSYHLTKAGHKLLSTSLLSYSAEIVQLYSSVKNEISKMLLGFFEEGVRTVVLFGVADTAEIVYMAMQDTPLVVIGVVDSDVERQNKVFNGLIIQNPDEIEFLKPDAVVITSFARQEEIYESIQALHGNKVRVEKISRL